VNLPLHRLRDLRITSCNIILSLSEADLTSKFNFFGNSFDIHDKSSDALWDVNNYFKKVPLFTSDEDVEFVG